MAHHTALGSSLADAVGALSRKKKGAAASEIEDSHSKAFLVVSEGQFN